MNMSFRVMLLAGCLPILTQGQSVGDLGAVTVSQKKEKGDPFVELSVRVTNKGTGTASMSASVHAVCLFDAVEKSEQTDVYFGFMSTETVVTETKSSGYLTAEQDQALPPLKPQDSKVVTMRITLPGASGQGAGIAFGYRSNARRTGNKKNIVGYHVELVSDGKVTATRDWTDAPAVARLKKNYALPPTWWTK